MNAPIIWIGFPLLTVPVLWIFRRYEKLAPASGMIICLLMAILAWRVPIDTLIRVASFGFEIESEMLIIGRKFVILNSERSLILAIYLFGAFWNAGLYAIQGCRKLVPFSVGILAMLIAALSVEPFLYAALIIEVVVLLSVPLFVEPGQKVGQGVLRYLIYQTLAMPLILFAGWGSSSVSGNLANEEMVLQTTIMLILGFMLWLAIFPFHTWIPLLAGETEPYLAGFYLGLIPVVLLMLLLDFLNAFSWLREMQLMETFVHYMGIILVIIAGLMAAFQRNLIRLLGYGVLFETGMALLAISVNHEVFSLMLTPRMFSLGLWAMSLSIIKLGRGVELSDLKGMLRTFPFVSLSLVVSIFCVGGFPLLGGFGIRIAIYGELVKLEPMVLLWVIFGSLGMLVAGFRVLSSLASGMGEKWEVNESYAQAAFLGVGVLILLVMGFFPAWAIPDLNLLETFNHLYP